MVTAREFFNLPENLMSFSADIGCGSKTFHIKDIAPAVYGALVVKDLVLAPFKHAKRMICERGYAKEFLGPSLALTAAFAGLAVAAGASAPIIAVVGALGAIATQGFGVVDNIGAFNDRAERANVIIVRQVFKNRAKNRHASGHRPA